MRGEENTCLFEMAGTDYTKNGAPVIIDIKSKYLEQDLEDEHKLFYVFGTVTTEQGPKSLQAGVFVMVWISFGAQPKIVSINM